MRQGIADAKVQALANAPVKCIACNGSGYYDTQRNGKTPKCGSCEGTGWEQKHTEWKRHDGISI